MQAQIAQLGAILGFTVWVPPSDRNRVLELVPAAVRDKFIGKLPLNYDLTTLKTIENIDVIWLQRRAIMHAFEVEHTTAIYSGLLRMADLIALQPRIDISLHIVAPSERQAQVEREVTRPVFSILEGGAMVEKCSFIPYEAVEEIMQKPDLIHMKESVLEAYEVFFDEG